MMESTISPMRYARRYSCLWPTRGSFLTMRTTSRGSCRATYASPITQCNQISATAYNRKLDVIVTADTGEDSMIVVWDVGTGTPRKTIFNPHPDGVVALDINDDGSMIVTLSKSDVPSKQQVSLWKWEEEEPLYITSEMDEKVKHLQKFVKFNHNEN